MLKHIRNIPYYRISTAFFVQRKKCPDGQAGRKPTARNRDLLIEKAERSGSNFIR